MRLLSRLEGEKISGAIWYNIFRQSPKRTSEREHWIPAFKGKTPEERHPGRSGAETRDPGRPAVRYSPSAFLSLLVLPALLGLLGLLGLLDLLALLEVLALSAPFLF